MPRVVDKEEKRTKIIQAAIHVFAQKGFNRTKAIDIAKAAGVGKGTLYEYFRSLNEIFAAAFHDFLKQMDSAIHDQLDKESDPLKQIELFVKITFNEFLNAGELAKVMMDFWAEGIRTRSDEILNTINLDEMYNTYRTLLSGIIKSGIKQNVFRNVDPKLTASMMIGVLDGLYLQYIMNPNVFDFNKMSQTLIDIFLNGITREE